jgi:predicted dehydrogenase
VNRSGRFVRVSSEFPFMPACTRAFNIARSGALGQVLEVRSGFNHASDMDPNKPINWKRQAARCGPLGVLADLGMHPLHVPFKLGWKPRRLWAQLQKVYAERPDGKGGMAACDTWDNALLNCDTVIDGKDVPMRIEMKRLSPGDTNNWFFEAWGTEGGVKFSTREARRIWIYDRGDARVPEQNWRQVDLGFQTAFKTTTGGIFEVGFPDCIQQMWAAFFAERCGMLGDRIGCVTVDEAVESHDLFAAALTSHLEKRVVTL